MAKDDRLYGRFTLDFADSHKIFPLSDAAFRCLVEATLLSRRMKSDGFIANALALAKWGASPLLELATNDPVNPSLIEVENGYMIHDFAQHQSTKAEIDGLIERRKAAGQKGGLARAKALAVAKPKQKPSKTYPETETETIKESKREAVPDTFESFWNAYPKRRDKGHARTAYVKALDKTDADTILRGAEMYRDDPTRADKFTKNAATWLNGECWSDEMTAANKPLPAGERKWEE